MDELTTSQLFYTAVSRFPSDPRCNGTYCPVYSDLRIARTAASKSHSRSEGQQLVSDSPARLHPVVQVTV